MMAAKQRKGRQTMMTRNEAKTATMEQLTDELAAAGWDSTQATREEALPAVLRLIGENPAELSRLHSKLCEAIERSRSHDEIVHVEVDDVEQARVMLCGMADDDADTDWAEANDGIVEVWCAADDASAGEMLWRVHLEPAE